MLEFWLSGETLVSRIFSNFLSSFLMQRTIKIIIVVHHRLVIFHLENSSFPFSNNAWKDCRDEDWNFPCKKTHKIIKSLMRSRWKRAEKKITGNFIKNLDNIKVWSARHFNFLVFPWRNRKEIDGKGSSNWWNKSTWLKRVAVILASEAMKTSETLRGLLELELASFVNFTTIASGFTLKMGSVGNPSIFMVNNRPYFYDLCRTTRN